MAAEAEAAREARAKVIAAEGEHQASRSLANAAEVITQTPAALQVSARARLLQSALLNNKSITGEARSRSPRAPNRVSHKVYPAASDCVPSS